MISKVRFRRTVGRAARRGIGRPIPAIPAGDTRKQAPSTACPPGRDHTRRNVVSIAIREKRVGSRKQGEALSECVREVRAGRTIVVTEHGHPAARGIPVAASLRGPDDRGDDDHHQRRVDGENVRVEERWDQTGDFE